VHLVDVWMIFTGLALTMYIVLDGYDLGIGVLTLLDPDTGRRRQMHELVAWLWDGNESWLVLLALTLWAGVPLVTGVALPALYIPLMLMLFSLIARGVALELIDHPTAGTRSGAGSSGSGRCSQGSARARPLEAWWPGCQSRGTHSPAGRSRSFTTATPSSPA
jgi:hypothetical protein